MTYPTHALSEKEKLRHSRRLQESLEFLRRIDKVLVTGTHEENHATFLDLTIVMTNSSSNGTTNIARTSNPSIVSRSDSAPTAKELEKERKKLRPSVDFQTSKGISTLKNIHDAIYEWSLKPHHRLSPDEAAPAAATGDGRDDSNESLAPPPCAYCSQFSSPAALDLWTKKNPQDVIRSDTGLVIVVNNYELPQHEKRINDCLRSARAVPPECLVDYDACCEGVAHIPSIVANFLQRSEIKTKRYSAALCGGGVM